MLANDDEDKANAFGDCFAAVYTRESDNVFNELPSRHSSVLRENVVFTEEAILDKLTSIKVNKSPGPDLLHPRVLHEARYQLVTPLLLLFEKLYTTGTLPCDWKVASTVPSIYKKGSKAAVNNYRPVSLMNVVCKVMEAIIRDHVMQYFLDNDFFSSKQYGFLKGRFTVLQLLKIVDEWTLHLDTGGQIDCIYMDFEKAI